MAVGAARNGKAGGATGEPVVERLLDTLEQICQKVDGQEDDQQFLQEVLGDRSLRALIFVYNRVASRDALSPSSHNAISLAQEVVHTIQTKKYTRDEDIELCKILSSHHIQGLLEAHDAVSRKDYQPILPEFQFDFDEEEEEEETVKIVQLVKSNEPLGATIRYNEQTGSIVIARVLHGGAADRSGLIHVGDEVHEVNGINVRGKAPVDVIKILQQSADGTITFKLVPAEDGLQFHESRVRVRAHFSYDPLEDPHIPCKEAGLPFSKGDVLHIVDQEDPNWWQARKEGFSNCRAALIPGRQLQERRLASLRDLTDDYTEVKPSPLCNSPKHIRGRKIKKVMYDAKENDDFDREDIATYEEVAKLYPRPGLHRPIVLIGPPGVGRNELKSRLIATNPDHYKTTIPYTSRPKKPWEVEGLEYHFISRELMEEEIQLGQFIEYGEYKGNLYGTSLETVRSIVNAGYICVMNPHPQALKKLRSPEFKPYIIFIKPPPLDIFLYTRKEAKAKSTFHENEARGFTEDEAHRVIYYGHKTEYLYGHMFDTTLVNDNLSRAFHELLTVVRTVDLEPHWVPASWVATC